MIVIRRTVAFTLDFMVMLLAMGFGLGLGLLGFISLGPQWDAPIVFAATVGFGLADRLGSPGMRVMRLQLRTEDGSAPSRFACCLREAIFFLAPLLAVLLVEGYSRFAYERGIDSFSALPPVLLVGSLLSASILLSRGRQGLHDMISRLRVVETRVAEAALASSNSQRRELAVTSVLVAFGMVTVASWALSSGDQALQAAVSPDVMTTVDRLSKSMSAIPNAARYRAVRLSVQKAIWSTGRDVPALDDSVRRSEIKVPNKIGDGYSTWFVFLEVTSDGVSSGDFQRAFASRALETLQAAPRDLVVFQFEWTADFGVWRLRRTRTLVAVEQKDGGPLIVVEPDDAWKTGLSLCFRPIYNSPIEIGVSGGIL